MTRSAAGLVLFAALGCSETEYAVLSQPPDVHPDEVTECDFESVKGSKELSRYSCNPVFVATDEAWTRGLGSITFTAAPVMGHAFYQMWYVGFKGANAGDFDVGYAISADGTEWTPHPENPGWPDRKAADWDGGTIQNLKVDFDPNTGEYVGLYGGISVDDSFFGIGAAISPDGETWRLEPSNPMLTLSLEYHGIDYAWPLAFTAKPGAYEAFLAGTSTAEGSQDVYRVRTDDYRHWDQEPTRIFKAGKDGDWDDEGVLDAAVVELDGVSYLFYTGFGRWDDQGTVRYAQDYFVGLATSTGDTWERKGKNPLPLHNDEALGAQIVAAEVVGTRIHLWVSDYYADLDSEGVGLFLYEPGGAQ